MPLIDGKKYACASCIKGHRSSSCAHADRPVFEIKKKGRPVSQCERCRELRQTNSLHTKCNCKKLAAAAAASPVPTPDEVPGTPAEPAEPDANGPNFKALRAIHRATIQRAFMCQCLNGGSCVCGQQAEGSAQSSSSGIKRKASTSAAKLEADESISLEQLPSQPQTKKSGCCSSKQRPSASSASDSTPSLWPDLSTTASSTPSLASTSAFTSEMLPHPSSSYMTDFFSPLPAASLITPSADLLFDPANALPLPAASSSSRLQPPPQMFDDWTWGDILVPDSLLPPLTPARIDAVAKGECRSCGPACLCGETCQCGHVKALQQELLAASDPLGRAFAESVLGLPLTQQYWNQSPIVGNQSWTAGHMPDPLSSLPGLPEAPGPSLPMPSLDELLAFPADLPSSTQAAPPPLNIPLDPFADFEAREGSLQAPSGLPDFANLPPMPLPDQPVKEQRPVRSCCSSKRREGTAS